MSTTSPRTSTLAPVLGLLLASVCSSAQTAPAQRTPLKAQPQQSTPAPTRNLHWAGEQQALQQALKPLGRHPQAGTLVQRYEQTLRQTERTLQQAQQALRVQNPDPNQLGRLSKSLEKQRTDIEQLRAQLVQVQKETVRNERQLASSQFENANQKASQYLNMLASVMKTLNETRSGIIRNLR